MPKPGQLLLFVALLIFGNAHTQQTNEQFNIPLKYLLSLPEGYKEDTAKKWPLLIFLHGSGESGDDLNKVKVHGPPKLIEQGKEFPFIVVSPQANGMYGWQPELLQHFLRNLKQHYRVDNNRVYLTGLSMGGYGTWNWATKYPKEFAAIVPICGGGDSSEVWKLKNVSVWCFHGGKDMAVPVSESYTMMDALKKYNPGAKLTIYAEAGHDSWTETYNNDSLYSWLLKQERKIYKAAKLPVSKLREYAGDYSRTGKDTLKIVIENEKLIAKTGGPEIEIGNIEGDSFFINEGESQFELNFLRNRNRVVNGMLFYGDKTIKFKKL